MLVREGMRRRLQLKVVLLVAATFAIALVVNTWFVLREFEVHYRAALLGKLDVLAADIGQKLASGLALGLRLEELPNVGAEARALLAPYPEIGYAVVVDAAGTIVHGSLAAADLASLGQALARVPAAGAREGGAPVAWQGGEYVDVSVPVRSAEAGRPQVGAIRLGLRGDIIEHELHDIWIGAFVVGALVLAAAVVLIVLLVSSAVTRPVFELVRAAEQIAGGDLTQRAAERGRDELAALGRAFNRMAERLQGLLRRIDGASAQVAQASDSISGSSRAVLGSAEAQAGSVDDASRSVGIMNRSVHEILASIDRLTHASQGSSSSILEMGATIEEVASNMEFLASSVEQTTASVEEVTAASREVAASTERLTGLASQTASAIHEFESAIREVDENARETTALSEKVQADAQAGMRAVRATIDGIEAIKAAAGRATGAIVGLSERIRSIDSILAIIDDVAEETNLLALNAAIIAAQAGEHGRGFGVVADEIRDLAERTGASTKEIASQVLQVQTEAGSAVEAMMVGRTAIDEGVRLAREAGEALQQIAGSAEQSVERVKGIARATAEQSRGSRQMTEAITQVASMAQRISVATREQSKSGEQILNAVEKMREIAHQVKQTTDEQAKGSRQITRAIEEMSEMILQINRATTEHGDSSKLIEGAVGRIKDTTQKNLASAADLNAVVLALGREAKLLRDEVQRFQL